MEPIELKHPVPAQVEIVNRGPVATQVVNGPIEVRVTSVKMRWGDMFTLIVQFLVCSVPAVLMVWFLWMMLFGSLLANIISRH